MMGCDKHAPGSAPEEAPQPPPAVPSPVAVGAAPAASVGTIDLTKNVEVAS